MILRSRRYRNRYGNSFHHMLIWLDCRKMLLEISGNHIGKILMFDIIFKKWNKNKQKDINVVKKLLLIYIYNQCESLAEIS